MSASSKQAMSVPSQAGVARLSDPTHGQTVRRRRTKLTSEKKLEEDELMAAAIGDAEWLKQSLKDSGSSIKYDKNVRIVY